MKRRKARARAKTKSREWSESERHSNPNIASKHLTKDKAKLVQAVAAESGATSKKWKGR